jgi:drug/metabolite transporter (DMT)-like permease
MRKWDKLLGLALAVFVILVWGVTFVSTKALLGGGFSALEILFIRFVMAYAALWALCPHALRIDSIREEFDFAMAGLSGVTAYQFLENSAIHFTNASNVSIIVSVCPLFTALLAWLLFRERALSPAFILGFLLAIGGIVLVATDGVANLHFNPVGDFMALASAVCWACYSMAVTRLNSRNRPVLAATRRVFFWALVFMLPLLAFGMCAGPDFMGGSLHVETGAAVNKARFSSWLSWLNLSFLGVLASALCFAGWNRACHILGTVRATVGIYAIPVVTVVFAYAFLGERLSAIGALGAVCTLIGVVLSSRTGTAR